MSERAGGSKAEGKGKKPHKNKPTSEKWKKYSISGSKVTSQKSCPRCGLGIFLALHKDRSSCGKCKYTEFARKSV